MKKFIILIVFVTLSCATFYDKFSTPYNPVPAAYLQRVMLQRERAVGRLVKLSATKEMREVYVASVQYVFNRDELPIFVEAKGQYNENMILTCSAFTAEWMRDPAMNNILLEYAMQGFCIVWCRTGGWDKLFWEWKFDPVKYGFIYE